MWFIWDALIENTGKIFHRYSQYLIYREFYNGWWNILNHTTKKEWINIFTLLFMITFVGNQQKLFRLSMVCLPLIHLLIILFLFSLPISMFHFCELVCSLLYSSMNLLALVVVKFLNMLLCFYLNSSLLYASSRIRTLNKLYKYFLP